MRTAKFLFLIFFCIFGSSLGDEATNQFTCDLLRVIFNENAVKENTNLSSISLYVLLALLQQGSGGNSLKELTKVLHANACTTRRVYTQLVQSLSAEHNETELEFANKIYLQDNFTIEQSFRTVAEQNFQADIENIDFGDNENAAEIINEWVSNNTHGRITELVSADSFSANTAMVLLNAVFFAGNWTFQFDPQGTQNSTFTTLENTTEIVPMMHLRHTLVAGQIEKLNATYVQLPFIGGEFSMTFVVPNEVDGLSTVIDCLQQDILASIISAKELRTVDLSLPKFKFSTTSELVPTLEKMGLHDIFTRASNLTGIARSPPLFVSDVIQKADIEVDERGATAAAATSVTVGITSIPIDILTIVADRSFFYIIADVKAVLPVFCGWVVAP